LEQGGREATGIQLRVGLTGVWRGGVSLIGVAFTGVGFIGGRSAVIVVLNAMAPNVRMMCSSDVSHR
jgi:hypothetical protein